MQFYDMEKFCDFFTLRPYDLNITLTYVLMDNSCPCLYSKSTCSFAISKFVMN